MYSLFTQYGHLFTLSRTAAMGLLCILCLAVTSVTRAQTQTLATSSGKPQADSLAGNTSTNNNVKQTNAPVGFQPHQLPAHIIARFGTPPDITDGPLDDTVLDALDKAFGVNLKTENWGPEQTGALAIINASGDARLAWLISDFMRIASSNNLRKLLADSASQLLNINFKDNNLWGHTTNQLIGWNIPAPPDYLKYKRNIYTLIVPEWHSLFQPGDIDWRHVSWGGVRIDNRAYDTTNEPCNCIPAADNPAVTSASEATWIKDEDIIFGIAVNGEYRAYPRRIMEVREMINDTLGGRDLGIPYCTLCASAQAYFTDELPEGVERPILRTSGLLIRSNKVMYDLNSFSVFDTFRGQAVTGPLANKQVKLKQIGVVTAKWGDWKAEHPTTTILAESLALGRDFDFRNTRDANGPIFPIGDVDPRLPIQEDIVGLVAQSGKAVAFQLSKAIEMLNEGEQIRFDNIQLVLDGGGVRAVGADGKDLGGHQSFWFAWSQFHPETKLWPL